MSSDEDEFASNFDVTTTPFRVVRVATKETTTKPTTKNRQQQNSRNGAGPSKPSSRTKRKRSPTSQPEQEEENDENDEEEEQEIIEVPKPLRSARVGPGRGGKAASLNQRQTKAKAKPASTTKRGKANAVGNGARTDDTMDVDEVRVVPTEPESGQEEDDDEEMDNHASGVGSRAATHTAATRGVGQSHKTAKNRRDVEDSRAEIGRSQREERMHRQIDQLKKQVEQVTATRNTLAQQLEELFRTRTTEAEEALEQHSAQYETRLKIQEEMIQELTSQLARVDSLTHEGKTSTLHFLTREAADEERRGLEAELTRLKDKLKEKDEELKAKDSQITEREETIQTLRSDLRAEIENTKAIMSRNANRERDPPPSASKSKPSALLKSDPKHALIIRLYEDLTNFLVTNIKADVANVNGTKRIPDETVYKCVYTTEEGRSLTFDLRYYTGEDDDGNPIDHVLYTPMQLDMEPDQEFVRNLGLLSDSFTFNRIQMDEFFKQLRIIVNGEEAAEGGD